MTGIITNYLTQHRRLVVPQLGTFVVKVPEGGVVFSELLKRDDGILRGLLVQQGGMNDLEAAGAIDRFVFEVRHALEHEGAYAIEGFGRLTLSPGGAISYVEVPNMQDNLKAVIRVMQYIYDNIMYAELNTKSDYCQVCGFDGEIEIVEHDGKLIWRCPNCGNTDQDKMNVARRTCGYIGTQFWNQGRTQEIKQRVLHL